MVSNLQRFFYHPEKSPMQRHNLSSFDFGENAMPNQHSNIHISGIYLPALLHYTMMVLSACQVHYYKGGEVSNIVNFSNRIISPFFNGI